MPCHAPQHRPAEARHSNFLLMMHIIGEGEGGSGSILDFSIFPLSSPSGDREAAGGWEWDNDESRWSGEAAPPQRQGAASHSGELVAVDVAEEGFATPQWRCSRDCFQMHTAKSLRLQMRSSGNRMFVMCKELWLGARYSPLVAA